MLAYINIYKYINIEYHVSMYKIYTYKTLIVI